MNKKKFIIALGIILLCIILIIVVIKPSKNISTTPYILPTPTSVSVNLQQQQGLTLQPGISTEHDVKNIYGNPVKTKVTNGTTIDYFAISNTWRQNKVYIKNDHVQYIVQEQIIDNSLYKDFVTNNNIQPDGILSDPEQSGSEIRWYIFSTKGIAFLADHSSGYAFRVIRFPSISYADFLKTVAPAFSMQQATINTRDNSPQ